MTVTGRIARLRRSGDSGFTIVEVLVAVILLGIVATSSLYFALRANTTSAYQQHNQIAVTIASQAMESVVATSTRLDGLYADRGQTALQSAWTANSAADGVAKTYQVWDTTAPTNSLGAIPITNAASPDRLSGTDYTTVVLIGSCFRPRSVAGADCEQVAGRTLVQARAAVTAGTLDSVEQIRVIVLVTWNADDECPSGCNYQTSTLVDAHSDLEWVS